MKFNKLTKIILPQLKRKISNHGGLAVFAKNRSKFEGWLKVELVDILSGVVRDVEPEKRISRC